MCVCEREREGDDSEDTNFESNAVINFLTIGSSGRAICQN